MYPLFAFLEFGFGEIFVIMVIAVLLFGERLPEVAKTLGKQFMEFKKGLNSIQEELQSTLRAEATSSEPHSYGSEPRTIAEDRDEATAPKFEPPKSEPESCLPVPTTTAEAESEEVR